MILENYQTVGIASDENKLKLSAIFFDKVYCIDNTIEVPKKLLVESVINTIQYETISEKIKSDFDSKYLYLLSEKILPDYFKSNDTVDRDTVIKILEKVGYEARAKTLNLYTIEAAKQISKGKQIAIPLFNDTILYDHLENDYLNNSYIEKVEIKIIDAPIIVPSELEWNQIIEAKKDPDFNKKVKRFSVFINKNYKGRDLPFIIDDLSLQIEDYKNACSKHGIRLANDTFKSLANSKSLFGTLGVALFALLAKMPEYAMVTGVVGAGLEVLNLKISVRQYQDSFETFVNESPISLIFEINKLKSKNVNGN